MDLSGFNTGEILTGLIAIAAGAAYARKQFSSDNLEITKSDTERELIQLLREQITLTASELTLLKEKHKELEENVKTIAIERDEAIKDVQIYKDDITRHENRVIVLENLVDRLTDALEIASANIDTDNSEEE